MKYVVDASLENGQPRLRVLDADTGVVHIEWSLTRVNQMFDEGEIDPDDFLHPERYGMGLLVKNLFLLSCVESMANKINQKKRIRFDQVSKTDNMTHHQKTRIGSLILISNQFEHG
ncbi:MAG: hypothetical protein AB8D52_07485 [Gammaproteobacteria bacterium]